MTRAICTAVLCVALAGCEYFDWRKHAQKTSTLERAGKLLDLASAFRKRHGRDPTVQGMMPPDCRGTECMLVEPLRDAWGAEYRLEIDGGKARAISPGPDGEFGTADDLVSEREWH